MTRPDEKLNTADMIQFVEAFEDNLDHLLELADIIRIESEIVGDAGAADLMKGVSQIVTAFRRIRQDGDPLVPFQDGGPRTSRPIPSSRMDPVSKQLL